MQKIRGIGLLLWTGWPSRAPLALYVFHETLYEKPDKRNCNKKFPPCVYLADKCPVCWGSVLLMHVASQWWGFAWMKSNFTQQLNATQTCTQQQVTLKQLAKVDKSHILLQSPCLWTFFPSRSAICGETALSELPIGYWLWNTNYFWNALQSVVTVGKQTRAENALIWRVTVKDPAVWGYSYLREQRAWDIYSFN